MRDRLAGRERHMSDMSSSGITNRMNLYELDSILEIEPPYDRDGLTEADVMILHIDKAMLTGNQNQFINFAETKNGRSVLVGGRFAKPTISALAVLLDLVNRPDLCEKNSERSEDPPAKKPRRSKKKDEEYAEEEESPIEKNKSWVYDAKDYHGDGETKLMNRMELYIETSFADDDVTVRGWFVYILTYDSSLGLDDGICMHASENLKGKTKELWKWETSVKQWIADAISPYADMRFTMEDVEDAMQVSQLRAAYRTSYRDPTNPARISNVFTFASSREHMDDTYSATQRDMGAYFNAAGHFTGFPFGAKRIPPTLRDPQNVLSGALERPAYATSEASTKQRVMDMITGSGASVEGDLAKFVAASFAREVNDDVSMRKTEIVDRYVSWISSKECPPGIAAAWEYIKPLVGTVVVPDTTTIVDPTLSSFGNALAVSMLVCEQLFAISYLHTELMFDVIAVGGAFRQKRTLRLHTLKCGPPASGKSYEMELLIELCVPKSTKPISYQTKRADTTDTNRNGLVRTMDEASENLIDRGGDGTGNSESKQILSSGVTYTETCVVDHENKTRTTMEVESKLLVLLMANTNASISIFPKPIVSRLMVTYVPERRRADLPDPTLRDGFAKIDDPMREVHVRRHHVRHGLVGLVSYAIDMKWLPEVDMSYAIGLLDDLLGRLEKRGCVPDARSKQRIPLYIRSVTIWAAVWRVFEGNDRFAPGTLFEMAHLVEVVRYLRASREIVYFAVSHMYGTLINVNAPTVCRAILNIINSQVLGKHPKLNPEDKYSVALDEDTYLLRVPMVGIRDDEIRTAAIKLLVGVIADSKTVVYSAEMISDTLNWMQLQRVPNTNRPAMWIHRHGDIKDNGVCFDTTLINSDATNDVLEVIKESIDDWVRGTDTRFILGITFREGNGDMVITEADGLKKTDGTPFESERMFPHLYRVIDCVDLVKTNKPFMMKNQEYKEFGWYELFEHCEIPKTVEKPFKLMRTDGDERDRVEFLRRRGLFDSRVVHVFGESIEMWNGGARRVRDWAEMTDVYENDGKISGIINDEVFADVTIDACVSGMTTRYPDSHAEAHEKRFDRTSFEVVGEPITPSFVPIISMQDDDEYI